MLTMLFRTSRLEIGKILDNKGGPAVLIRSMLYHRKPLFYLFIALLAAAIAAGVWLFVRSPVQNAGNQGTPAPSEDYTLTVVSGNNAIQAPGYLAWWESKEDHVTGDMMRKEIPEIAEHIKSIEIDPNTEGTRPFAAYIQDKEVYGQYRLYDESFEEIEVLTSSGPAPQTYLFQGCEPGRYIVSFETSFEDEESYFGYQYFFGVIVPEEDRAVTAPGEPAAGTEGIALELYQDGESIHKLAIHDPGEEQIVKDAIFNYMIKSAAWPAVDINTIKNRICITISREDTPYYVFDMEGRHCMQRGGMYSILNSYAYIPLINLAAGCYPEAMTVTCGGDTITVPGLVTFLRVPGEPDIRNTGYEIAQGVDDLPTVLYTEDMALTIGDTPVHIFRGDPEQGEIVGLCSVYDSEGHMLDNGHMMQSALPPDFVEPETPGHYIVKVLIQEGDRDSMQHTEYAYAIDIAP